MIESQDQNEKMGGNRKGKTDTINSKTPVLDNFSRDLIKLAKEGKLDPVIGREHEIERLAQIISRRKKNNPILIGEPGCGKTAIVEGLAMKIFQGDCPQNLIDKRIVSLDMTSIVAGTKYRGQFEERIKVILDELSDNHDVVIFIDEIHTIIGAGNSSGSLDASNIFKPALARGELQCIGATTLDEYREHIEKDGALERRFQKVHVDATSIEDTIKIMNRAKENYEKHHKVHFSDDVIKTCVMLADRYITDREFPDKAIDIMDEVGARCQINVTVPEIIEKLNLIGFEVDDIYEEFLETDLLIKHNRLLLKIPANREDLLIEELLLKELLRLFSLENISKWKSLKNYYIFLLKKHYFSNYKYNFFEINSNIDDILIYNIQLIIKKNIKSMIN